MQLRHQGIVVEAEGALTQTPADRYFCRPGAPGGSRQDAQGGEASAA